MCGLFGFVNRDLTKLKLTELISQSLILNSLRGIDGAGVALVDPKGEVHMYKRPLPGWDLLQLSPTKSLIANCDLPVFGMIHNRAGTSGGNKIDTSHPINYKHITLVHNGSVHALTALGADYSTHDSTAVAMALADKNEKEALELIEGSYALMWYNQLDHTFNLARNEDRPLYIATIKKSKSLFLASESGMLFWLAERNDIEIKDINLMPTAVHTKISIDPEVKSKAVKFVIKTLPKHYSYSANDWGYSLTAKDEIFVGEYKGVLDLNNNNKTFKFKRASDPMYGWLTPYHAEIEKLLIVDKNYTLKCTEPRFTKSNSGNLSAELISTVPLVVTVLESPDLLKDFYKPGLEVDFTVDVIYPSSKGNSKVMVIGYTDDSSLVEVRAPQVTNPNIEKNVSYTATVKSMITTSKGAYILVDPNSIKLKATHQVDTFQCGWCTDSLTRAERMANVIPGMSNGDSLCNKCMSQYSRAN